MNRIKIISSKSNSTYMATSLLQKHCHGKLQGQCPLK